jgi:hypothetical protein
VPLDGLWPRQMVSRLHEELIESGSSEDRFRSVEQALLRNPARALDLHPAVQLTLEIFCRQPQLSVSPALDHIGISQRSFIEMFPPDRPVTKAILPRSTLRTRAAPCRRLRRGYAPHSLDGHCAGLRLLRSGPFQS